FARTLENQELIIAVNVGTESITVNIDCSNLQNRPNQVLFGNGDIFWKSDHLCLTIPPRSGLILN
ncbi:MAG: alpha-amylase, partial [Dolichospermum sp.]